MNKTLLGIVALCILLVGLLWLAFRSQKILTDGLPPKVECTSQKEAADLAGKTAHPVLGTGSMAPYIPAAKPGQVPLETIVAYVVPSNTKYANIEQGDLCAYWYTQPDGKKVLMLHQAALKDSHGWVMSGYHNKRSESWARVTEENFVCTVSKSYIYP